MSSKHERSAFLLLIIDMFYFDFTFRSFNHLDVRSEVILINFGFVGFVVGLVSSLILDIDNLKSVLTDGITMDNILISPLIQILAMGLLIFVSQMLMNILFRIETTGVGTLLQKATEILFSFGFQIILYKVRSSTIETIFKS